MTSEICRLKLFCDWLNGSGMIHVDGDHGCYSSRGNLKLNEAGLSSINGSCFPSAGQVSFPSQSHLHRLMEANGLVIYSFLRLIKVILCQSAYLVETVIGRYDFSLCELFWVYDDKM